MVVSCYAGFLYDRLASNKSSNSTPVPIIVVPVALHLSFCVHFAGNPPTHTSNPPREEVCFLQICEIVHSSSIVIHLIMFIFYFSGRDSDSRVQ